MTGDADRIQPTITAREASRRAWDAVVIGAGPAGASAAIGLAARARTVLLIDREAFPRGKVCGCCLSGDALDTLRRLAIRPLPVRPLRRARIAARGRQAEVAMARGGALSRSALDGALVLEAIGRGVHFLPSTPARLAGADTASAIVAVRDGALRSSIALIADGLRGSGANWGWRSARTSRIGLGATAPAHASDLDGSSVELVVGRAGYVGFVRLETGEIDIAAAVSPRALRETGSPAGAISRICADAGRPPPNGLASLRFRGTPPLTRVRRRLASPRAFALGDGAGYVEPFTGEGIAWALRAGELIAPIADDAIEAWTAAHAARWEREWRAGVRRRQLACRAVSAALRSDRVAAAAIGALAGAPALARPLVRTLGRAQERPA